MKKGKTRKLIRRILSFVLTTALVVGLMPGNMLKVSAEGTDTIISDELIVESVSSNDASATTECTCETDDPAFHATNCPAYITPENPQCYCAEKCTEDTLNVWCDVCGVQGVSACQGEETAVAYANGVASITNGETVTNYATFDEALANWTDGTTLTLLADVTLTECIKTYEKGLILDLNGHKIECSDTSWTIWIDGASGSELTIRDSQDGGHINGEVYAVGVTGGGSKLCLESGTVETVAANGDFIMTGGRIISEDGSGLSVNGEVDVVISGGEIYGSRCGVWITNGNVIISGDTKITGAGQYAIRSSYSAEVVISGTPTISGEAGEFDLGSKITLNTQPANGEVWSVKIDTGEITDGIFAVPGEDIALDASKFASAMDGYEVKQNAKGELLLCNHTEQTAASNGDGTHNTTCNCGEATFDTNVACSGGVATDTHQAYCEYCNAPYGELNPDVHCDIIALTMTTEELEDALLELLNSGETDISILLASKADEEMFTAINTALCSSTAVEGSVNLTIAGVQVVTNGALGNGHPIPELNTDPVALKTLNFPDAVTLERSALSLPSVQAVYLPKVTEWKIGGIKNADNISTLVLTAQGTITADFTSLSTYYIDLKLHCNKKNDVTDGTTWQGKTWKSISFDHKDSAHTTGTNNGNGTHSFTCTVCNDVAIQECTDEYSVVENKITKKCTACGDEKGYIIITAEGGIYDGTTAYGATVEKTGILESEEVTVNYYQGDTLIGTDAPVNAGTYTAKITYEEVTVYDEFEIAKATPYIKTAVAADAITYGEALKNSALSGGVVQYSETDETAVAGSWSWKEVTTKPVFADSNVTEYDVVFTPTDTENYNKVETKITLTVNKEETTPNMPESTMNVSYSKKTVGDVELPEGWVWSDADSTKELTVGVAVEATAIYNGADKGNYVTESVKILITCQACTHTWNGGVVTKEATATEKGKKTYTCSVCKTTKTEEIPALGAPKVGAQITSEDGSAAYKVTETGENGNAVTYEAPTDKNATTVKVPATVTINNITYNVTTISDTAFAGNKKLTSVTIGDNVTGFSAKTFKGCSNLKTLIIGNGVTSIPANAFKNFKKLTTVKMGTGVKTIGKNAFYGCKALKTITIGKSVTKIGSKAFYGCSKVKTLTIKSSKLTTKKIGSKAFTKTPKSMTVKVPKKKLKAYKSMLIKRGVNKKAKFKKN